MYQHHIQLTTAEKLDINTAMAWYETVKQYGPENNIQPYYSGDLKVAMEYGTREGDDMPNIYTVPLQRDLTTDETMFIVQAWEYLYKDDFNIEISNQYNANAFGDFENSIEIDEDIKTQAINDMGKWSHNRWVDAQISEGWRAGNYYSSKEKTHPALKNWDLLPESHRRSPQFTDQDILEWLQKNKII
jgi:hypothetical protein